MTGRFFVLTGKAAVAGAPGGSPVGTPGAGGGTATAFSSAPSTGSD